mmetsp:Transcript_7130/g.10397  ORF Transcript_7130/g.10397 Transcript_7130/m.10397 type:complete len:143 (+) Transcript_7130:48-476(+)|eukprot:CAMPEP_0194213418 /NCGR_PEP_ID=MMETSP0156-20130528/13999_1 /TAXON_ID=33649 /ORGANISM="Thalassionema nitzschioides, Strain L26-B" /LENGTH=142 /DNA_ID=CAMNT_0038941437 /DNA_START=22 /DNA_END=450 /DNA_ORIENTATION=-
MNGPKVREVIKTEIVSERTARKLMTKFLEREGEEEIKTDEALTRLSFMAQFMGKADNIPSRTPIKTDLRKESKEKEQTKAEKLLRKQEKKAKKQEEKEAKKVAKQEKKEAKKQAKRERKEKRKKDKESPTESKRNAKKQKTK